MVATLQMPPPVMGLSVVNAAMVARLKHAGLLLSVLNIGGSAIRGRHFKLVIRAWRVLVAVPYLILSRIKGARILYMAPDKGKGLLFNIMLAGLARALGYRLYLHHHNYAYVSRRHPMMARLLSVVPRGTRHIFLCDGMAQAFHQQYADRWEARRQTSIVVPNAFIMQDFAASPRGRDYNRALTIGHLSNLTVEKGIERFLKLFTSLARQAPVRGIVAGPADDAIAAGINKVIDLHDGALVWLGPVYGDDKTGFYDAIDAFVMPTVYDNEAQPLVLLEALAHGVPVIATDIGCTACDHVASPGRISSIETFENEAVAWLRQSMATPDARRAATAAAHARFTQLRAESEAAVEHCMALLAEDAGDG